LNPMKNVVCIKRKLCTVSKISQLERPNIRPRSNGGSAEDMVIRINPVARIEHRRVAKIGEDVVNTGREESRSKFCTPAVHKRHKIRDTNTKNYKNVACFMMLSIRVEIICLIDPKMAVGEGN
jgi:hypothetical protein